MRRLVNLKLQRGTTVAKHTSEFQKLVNQLTSVDLQFEDETQALLLLSSLPKNWETLVVSLSNSAPNGKLTTSMVMDALFNEEPWRREMSTEDSDDSRALVLEGSRERGRGQGRGHQSACEILIRMENNTANRVVGKGIVRFRMADSKGCSFEASGGTLRVYKGNKEMLRERKTRGLYQLKESVQTGRATVRHGSNGISKKNRQGKLPLHKGTQNKHKGTWRLRSGTRAQGDDLRCVEVWPDTSGATSAGCLKRSSEEGDKVDFEKLNSD
ncbi:hypothetical protein Acr_20g0010560 [Actinidia rufa]|uniref:Uncharacterized protein n=1 Tax=Actinidia rufa TaxID=165716 RepID=A0A7J0GEV5_9ERIC|nr:hypothetical protein Acr_20g0010560 [Actinidia rufa]